MLQPNRRVEVQAKGENDEIARPERGARHGRGAAPRTATHKFRQLRFAPRTSRAIWAARDALSGPFRAGCSFPSAMLDRFGTGAAAAEAFAFSCSGRRTR